MVLWVSWRSCSLFSIYVLSSLRNFLLSSSSCLHLRAFLKMFSRLFDSTPTCDCWPPGAWARLPWRLGTAFPPTLIIYPSGSFLSAVPSANEVVVAVLKSFNIRFLKFFISSTYCISASLFFYIRSYDFYLHIKTSSKFLRLNCSASVNLIAISGFPYWFSKS